MNKRFSNQERFEAGRPILAIAQDSDVFRAVVLRKTGSVYEVLHKKTFDCDKYNYQEIISEFAGKAEAGNSAGTNSAMPIVIGFDSAGVVFYHLTIPSAGEQEIDSIVKLQAESRFPLPADQMETSWRSSRSPDGKMEVTIAAGRRRRLKEFVAEIEDIEPEQLILDYEGLAEARKNFFSSGPGGISREVVMSVEGERTRLCLVEKGLLYNAASIDTGKEDLVAEDSSIDHHTMERFAQDVESALDLFGYAEPDKAVLSVLTNGNDGLEKAGDGLKNAGLNVKVVVPDEKATDGGITKEEIYNYRAALGIGAVVLNLGLKHLDLFKRLYKPSAHKERMPWLHSAKAAGGLALAMLVILVLLCYLFDVITSRKLNGAELQAHRTALVERQNLIKAAARQRPDFLKLLKQLIDCKENDVILDSLHYKKGKPVSINGQARSAEQIYKFQEELQKQKDIHEVKLQNTSPGGLDDRLKFTMFFHYGNFTQKQAKTGYYRAF